MRRRKFVVGLGSIAAGGSAIVGSGAFSAAQMSRNADINVVNDANGLIALSPGPNIGSDVVRLDDGELTIDFTADGSAGGVNVNSRYQVGVFDSSTGHVPDNALESDDDPDEHAFVITNQDTVDHRLNVAYSVENRDISNFGGANLYIQFAPHGDENDSSGAVRVLDDPGSDGHTGNGRDSFHRDLPAGDSYRATLLVDTRDVEGDLDDIDLSGTLEISAGPPQQD